jgi:hypothetical protein
LHKIKFHVLLIAVVLSLAFAGGCGKSSSTDSGVDEEAAASKKCGRGKSCQGTYSTLSSDDKEWSGVCEVKQVDSGEWTKIWFARPMKNCGFEWIRAQGSVGSDWAALAGGGTARDFMVEYTGENVYTLRLCEGGGNKDNTGCK